MVGGPASAGFDTAAYVADLSPTLPRAEVDNAVDRRVFAIPFYGTTIRGEDFPTLNPADPAQRALLIEGEHTEFHEALTDPSWEGEVDGVNPRLHLALHEIIVNQLWDDNPPQTWQAARRLRGRGKERHDILHELMGVAIEHMHPVLARHTPFDLDAYQRALNGLGA